MRVSAFLIFVLLLGCGKTDSSKGGKGSDVTKAGVSNTDSEMKSGPSDGAKKTPDDSMSGSKVVNSNGGTGAKSDTGTGNTSKPVVVKNDAAKPVTPVVKKETPVWDWPVKAKYDIPKCRILYFHNENLVSDIHRGGKTVMVYRYRDGKLEFKKDIWVGEGEHFWPLPDGKILYFSRVKENDLKTVYLNNIFIINENFNAQIPLYKACAFSYFDSCIYLKNGGSFVHIQMNVDIGWIDKKVYGDIENWQVLTIDYKNGKLKKKQKIKELEIDSEMYDWALGNIENCTKNSWGSRGMNSLISTNIYKNKKKLVTAEVFNGKKKGACRNGKAELIIFGSNEKNPTNLYDDALMKLIRPFCKRFSDIWFTKYRIQNRPGGGFVLLFKMGFYDGEAGSYYREYSAEGKPIGPVIKTKSEVEILSENHYRVTEGCHYEYRHRPGK